MLKHLLCSAVLLGLFFPPAPSFGCLNDYRPNHEVQAKARTIAGALTEVSLKEPWAVRAERLQKEAAAGGDYTVQNDLASALMHVGEPARAIPLLLAIEEKHPGLYRTASNLGTAYELTGDPVRALEWIKKGIERNPLSHDGSEWIHVRILEAKIAHAGEPDWWPETSILGLDFGGGGRPRTPDQLPVGNAGQPLTLAEVEAGLRYQLHERLQFVRPPDAIVASLLLDYADTVAVTKGSAGVAEELYGLTRQYARGDNVSATWTWKLEDRLQAAQQASRIKLGWLERLLSPVGSEIVLSLAILLLGAIYLVCRLRKYLAPAAKPKARV